MMGAHGPAAAAATHVGQPLALTLPKTCRRPRSGICAHCGSHASQRAAGSMGCAPPLIQLLFPCPAKPHGCRPLDPLASCAQLPRLTTFKCHRGSRSRHILCSISCCVRASVPALQVKYSQLIHGLKQENIEVNRKVLSELAMNEPYSFKALVDQVRFMHGSRASSSSSASSSRAAAPISVAPK